MSATQYSVTLTHDALKRPIRRLVIAESAIAARSLALSLVRDLYEFDRLGWRITRTAPHAASE